MIPTPADSNAWGARVALTSGVSLNETIAVPKAMMKLTKHHDRLALTPNPSRRGALTRDTLGVGGTLNKQFITSRGFGLRASRKVQPPHVTRGG